MTDAMPRLPNAACRTPEGAQVFTRDEGYNTARAKQICAGCTDREDCFAWAIRHESGGVWAGYTGKQLDGLRRKSGIRLVEIRAGEVAPRTPRRDIVVTALQRLGVAAAVVVAGVETAFAAAVEAPAHPGAALGDVAILAGSAAAIALAAAIGHAHDAGRRPDTADAQHDAGPPPVEEQPTRARLDREFMDGYTTGRDDGHAEGHAEGYRNGWTDGYAEGYTAGATPSTARHGTPAQAEAETTRWDLTPLNVTQEFPRIDDKVPDHWRPPVSATAAEREQLAA